MQNVSDGDELRAIAGVIQEAGWWNLKHTTYDRGNKQCIMTAYNALTGPWVSCRTLMLRRLAAALVDEVSDRRLDVVAYPENVVTTWNDNQRSKRAVVRRLRELAEKWDADDGKMLQDK